MNEYQNAQYRLRYALEDKAPYNEVKAAYDELLELAATQVTIDRYTDQMIHRAKCWLDMHQPPSPEVIKWARGTMDKYPDVFRRLADS